MAAVNILYTAKVGILLLGRELGATIGLSQLKCVIFIQLQLQPLLVLQHYAMNSVKLAFDWCSRVCDYSVDARMTALSGVTGARDQSVMKWNFII